MLSQVLPVTSVFKHKLEKSGNQPAGRMRPTCWTALP